MNFYQHSPEQINQLADALEDPDLDMNGLGWKAAFHLRELQGRIFELEAQLYAIGAGGVGASIQPQAQPDRKPLTDEHIIEWVRSGEYNVTKNDWASHIEFTRAIEASHGITGGQ